MIVKSFTDLSSFFNTDQHNPYGGCVTGATHSVVYGPCLPSGYSFHARHVDRISVGSIRQGHKAEQTSNENVLAGLQSHFHLSSRIGVSALELVVMTYLHESGPGFLSRKREARRSKKAAISGSSPVGREILR